MAKAIFLFLTLLLSATLVCGSPAEAPGKPNIIVFFSDDQGYADLGVQGVRDDVRTPHLDQLAAEGVRFTDGYITAPQCSPSRAGLLTGRYQQRFGYDHIGLGPLPLGEVTLADRLRKAGYVTGMVGKWHLAPDNSHQAWIKRNAHRLVKEEGEPWAFPDPVKLPYMPGGRGFDEYFCGWNSKKACRINFNLDGTQPHPEGEWTVPGGDRTAVHTEAALAFIKRRDREPFFLYLAYSIPHVPLEASAEQLKQFPGDMPERRRYALAMMWAMDEGIGRIVDVLRARNQYDNTLFFFASDNGAPLKLTMPDTKPPTLGGPSWDGSRNDPMRGEKGMLSEGGIRVPFLAAWPGRIPAGQVYTEPVIALDIAATALAAAGLPPAEELDGVDLVPYLRGEEKGSPHDALYWRFWSQSAVRAGDWKLLRLGEARAFLFDLRSDPGETHNVLDREPDKARELRAMIEAWATGMKPPTLPRGAGTRVEPQWYNLFFGPAAP